MSESAECPYPRQDLSRKHGRVGALADPSPHGALVRGVLFTAQLRCPPTSIAQAHPGLLIVPSSAVPARNRSSGKLIKTRSIPGD